MAKYLVNLVAFRCYSKYTLEIMHEATLCNCCEFHHDGCRKSVKIVYWSDILISEIHFSCGTPITRYAFLKLFAQQSWCNIPWFAKVTESSSAHLPPGLVRCPLCSVRPVAWWRVRCAVYGQWPGEVSVVQCTASGLCDYIRRTVILFLIIRSIIVTSDFKSQGKMTGYTNCDWYIIWTYHWKCHTHRK